MRISDWSSDVCSSDLRLLVQMNRREAGQIARKLRESIGIGIEGMDCGAAFRDRPREAPDVGATGDGDVAAPQTFGRIQARPEEHTLELQPLMRIAEAGICLKKTNVVCSQLL